MVSFVDMAGSPDPKEIEAQIDLSEPNHMPLDGELKPGQAVVSIK